MLRVALLGIMAAFVLGLGAGSSKELRGSESHRAADVQHLAVA
jgi:hypothetical protein